MSNYRTKKHTVNYKGRNWEVPAGLKVKLIDRGATAGKYWLDEPDKVFPTYSIELHDATYRGVIIEPQNITPNPIKDSYPDGGCPNCGDDISEEGEVCIN